jgi:hypothetical protein
VPEHVAVNLEREAGALTDALYKPIEGVGRERPAALGGEHIPAVGILPVKLAQRPEFVTTNGVSRGLAVLRAADVERGVAAPFDLTPFEVANLARPQTMPKRDQDQRGVAVPIAGAMGA